MLDTAAAGVWCSLWVRVCVLLGFKREKTKIKTHIYSNSNNKYRADAYAFLFKQIEEPNTQTHIYLQTTKQNEKKICFTLCSGPPNKTKKKKQCTEKVEKFHNKFRTIFDKVHSD